MAATAGMIHCDEGNIDFKHKEVKEQEAEKEVLRYGFLLDSDVVMAISKGNSKLLNLAKAMVDYLLKVIDPVLISRGILGEDEALCKINVFLHDNGWWARADNLNIREFGLDIGCSEDDLSKSE